MLITAMKIVLFNLDLRLSGILLIFRVFRRIEGDVLVGGYIVTAGLLPEVSMHVIDSAECDGLP